MSSKYEFVRHLAARIISADWSETGINSARIQKMVDGISVLVLNTPEKVNSRKQINYHLLTTRYIFISLGTAIDIFTRKRTNNGNNISILKRIFKFFVFVSRWRLFTFTSVLYFLFKRS